MTMNCAVIAVATSLSLFGFAATAADYQEAPILSEMVKAGTLPPVDERLPTNPRVIEPLDEVGTYGGTIRRGSALLFPFLFVNMTREPLITYNYPFPGEAPPQPNLAESWAFNDEGTEMTIKIREGIKWSDGAPLTTDDIMFFWYDVMLDDNTSVQMAPALFVEAGVVPELHLDVSVQAQVLNLLTELQEELGLTYLFITHDLSVANYICDRVMVMYLGQVLESGPVDRLFEAPQSPYTETLLSAVPDVYGRRTSERIVLQSSIPSPADPPPGC